MNQDGKGRNGPSDGDLRRRGIARAVPLPDEGHGETMALIVLFVSAAIAFVARTLMTALF